MIENPYRNLVSFLRRFMVLPSESDYSIMALWILHTYFLERCWSTPRLAFISPEYGCGKSRGLELLASLSFGGKKLNYCTRSYLMRSVDQMRNDLGRPPTLLIDEVDNVMKDKSEAATALTAFLNTGYTKSGFYGITDDVGNKKETRDFSTFAPIAFAGKGENSLPEAVATRSIIFRVQRRMAHQEIEDFGTFSAQNEADELRQWLESWAEGERIALALEDISKGVPLRDRDREVWLPLFGMAHLTGATDDLLAALDLHLKDRAQSDPSFGVALLEDVLKVFDQTSDPTKIKTSVLISSLNALEGADYQGLRYGKGLDSKLFAKKVRGYGITPKQLRFGDETGKGYEREPFENALNRYAFPSPIPLESETPETPETSDDEMLSVPW